MSFPTQRMDPESVAAALEAMRDDDVDWRHGRAWSLVYSAGPEHDAVIADAHRRYASENGLSPTAFPSLARMEREVVHALLDLLGGDPERSGGTMASGGTESIILAVKAHRDASGVDRPSMVVPSTAHPAFAKAGHLLGVETVIVPVESDLMADVDAMAEAINARTILLAASAPCFPYGLVDPIPALGVVALERGIGLHIDACLGGVMLPVLASLGHDVPPFDLSVPGVTSLTADLHKYGYGPKGSSTILYADRRLRRAQLTAHIGWPGGALASPTLLGTRPGGATAGAWAAIHHLGLEGYQELFRTVAATAGALRQGIEAIGDLAVVGDPPGPVFAFGSATRDIFAVADAMEARGWRMDRQVDPDCLHLIVNPVHTNVVEPFLADLAASYHAAPPRPERRGEAVVYGVTAHVVDDGDLVGSLLDSVEARYDLRAASMGEAR
jgi:glutamate/tyrosine decarboxylase-like PLP-dependent enzyme